MKKVIIAVIVSTVLLLLLSMGMLYGSIYLFPKITEEYFSPVFRSSGTTDWMYYLHPLVLCIALNWFWERYKNLFKGNIIVRAIEVAFVYGIVAMLPVLWLTFSAIDVSFRMVATWFLYGLVQSFVAGLVFAKLNP